jgi:hypothetical protein
MAESQFLAPKHRESYMRTVALLLSSNTAGSVTTVVQILAKTRPTTNSVVSVDTRTNCVSGTTSSLRPATCQCRHLSPFSVPVTLGTELEQREHRHRQEDVNMMRPLAALSMARRHCYGAALVERRKPNRSPRPRAATLRSCSFHPLPKQSRRT